MTQIKTIENGRYDIIISLDELKNKLLDNNYFTKEETLKVCKAINSCTIYTNVPVQSGVILQPAKKTTICKSKYTGGTGASYFPGDNVKIAYQGGGSMLVPGPGSYHAKETARMKAFRDSH